MSRVEFYRKEREGENKRKEKIKEKMGKEKERNNNNNNNRLFQIRLSFLDNKPGMLYKAKR